jgi:hypothetical protein
MKAQPDFGPLDLTEFTVGAMLRAGIAIRRLVKGCGSLEAAAEAVVRYLHEHCVGAPDGDHACALVRFYKTHPYDGLEPELQQFAAARLGTMAPRDDMRCLTLLASVGDEEAWNSRHTSTAHKVIPLPSAEAVRSVPMVTRLIEELGLDIESVVTGPSRPAQPGDTRTYDVFHVERALGSPYIPAQMEFVVPYGIQSVVGFGGLLRSGEMFAVILFSRVPIPRASAARFRTIALDVRSSLFTFDDAHTWRDSTEDERARRS